MSKNWLIILIIVALSFIAYVVYSFRSTLIPFGEESAIEKLESQNSSDEVSSIENDLTSTNLENLNTEISNIEQELQNTSY